MEEYEKRLGFCRGVFRICFESGEGDFSTRMLHYKCIDSSKAVPYDRLLS